MKTSIRLNIQGKWLKIIKYVIKYIHWQKIINQKHHIYWQLVQQINRITRIKSRTIRKVNQLHSKTSNLQKFCTSIYQIHWDERSREMTYLRVLISHLLIQSLQEQESSAESVDSDEDSLDNSVDSVDNFVDSDDESILQRLRKNQGQNKESSYIPWDMEESIVDLSRIKRIKKKESGATEDRRRISK